jgi:hypothetical protein
MANFFKNRELHGQGNHIDYIWLNFVDKNENKSEEEKFAKLSIVDLLRDGSTQLVLDNEEKLFYELLGDSTTKFI